MNLICTYIQYYYVFVPGGPACSTEGVRSWRRPLAPSWPRRRDDGAAVAAAAARSGVDHGQPPPEEHATGGGRPWRASRTPAPAPGGRGRSPSRSMAPRLPPAAADDGCWSRRRVPKPDLSSLRGVVRCRVASLILCTFVFTIYIYI